MATGRSCTPFDGTNGQSPEGGLVEADDGRFYGTTLGGGQLNLGTFYSVDASGDFEVIESFTRISIADPGALIQGSDGNFYGASGRAGFPLEGTVLPTRSSAGGLEILHEFDGADGCSPAAGVIEASDGYLYGATEFGGPADYGVVYGVSPLGEFELLHAFVTDGGTGPLRALVESPAGTLIGTTGDGGASGGGTAFSSDTSGPGDVPARLRRGRRRVIPRAGGVRRKRRILLRGDDRRTARTATARSTAWTRPDR